jgi:hypothetical protein
MVNQVTILLQQKRTLLRLKEPLPRFITMCFLQYRIGLPDSKADSSSQMLGSEVKSLRKSEEHILVL